MPAAVVTLAVVGLCVLGALAVARRGTSWWRRALATAGTYVRNGLATRRTWVGVVVRDRASCWPAT